MNTLSGMIVDSKIPVYSYEWLCQKMMDRGRVAIVLHNPAGATIRGIINGIRPEDGSGRHWLVTIHDNGVTNEVYVRTS
jgi:hypothetical protein